MPFWKWLIFIVIIVLVLGLSLFLFCALKISDISEIELWLLENVRIKNPKCVFLFRLSNILNLDYNELLKYRFASFYRKIDAKMECFDFILTKEVSRFARDTLDSIQFVKSIFDNKNSILEEIYSLLNEASNSTDYQKEKSKISKQIIEVEKQKDNLFIMRSSNEISSEEFAEYRNKYNSKIDTLNEAFNKIVALEKNTKTSLESVETLRKTIENIISINDDSVLSIASSLFEKIIVETNHEKNGNKKAVLHCQLKIEGDKRYNLPLKELSLLFKSNESFCRTKW